MTSNNIGEKIKKIREFQGIKQEAMAKILKISQPAYANMENGKTKIKAEDLSKIAKELQIPLEQLMPEDLQSYSFQYNSCENSVLGSHNEHNALGLIDKDLFQVLLNSKENEIRSLKEIITMQKKEIENLKRK